MLRRPRPLLRNERGIALILSVMVLLCLTGLVLAYLSVSSLEPQISRNLSDGSRARYMAESGIERGYNVLVTTADGTNSWSGLLGGATSGNPWVAVAGLTNVALTGVTNGGTFSVTVRNDNGAADSPLTGLTGTTNPTMDSSLTIDSNRVVIMRSTGTFNGMTKTIEVVVRRVALPPFPGAVNVPGRQSDTSIGTTSIDFDGQDYMCSSNCDTAASWTVNSANPLKYGMASQTGTQANNGNTYETNVQATISASEAANIRGKNQTNPTGPVTTGLNTIAADASLNPTVMDAFVELVASNPATTILQSTIACPMVFTGATSGSTNTPTLTNGCGTNTNVNLGSRTDPKLVFFRGELDSSSSFTGLRLNNNIKGAGILVIQDGDMKNYGNLDWDGIVIVTGRYTSMALMNGSTTNIRGAAVAYESTAGETAGYFDLYVENGSNSSVKASKQNIDLVQLMKSLHAITNWREI